VPQIPADIQYYLKAQCIHGCDASAGQPINAPLRLPWLWRSAAPTSAASMQQGFLAFGCGTSEHFFLGLHR
jgi:hypothetical protein